MSAKYVLVPHTTFVAAMVNSMRNFLYNKSAGPCATLLSHSSFSTPTIGVGWRLTWLPRAGANLRRAAAWAKACPQQPV